MSPDGRRVGFVTTQDRYAILDVEKRSVDFELEHPSAEQIAFSPTGDWTATGTWKGNGVRVRRTVDGRLERELSVKGGSCVAFSPGGRWLVTGSADAFRFFKVGSWELSHSVDRERSGGQAGPVAFAPGGAMAALNCSTVDIGLVLPETGQEIARLARSHRSLLSTVVFSPDGTLLLVIERPDKVQVWDLRRVRATLAVLGLDWDPPPLPAPTGGPALRLELLAAPAREEPEAARR
jgi:WD40 repeat protein